jgi:hypothetical protein
LLEIIDTCTTGVVLDERSTAAFDHLEASRRWESEEEHRRSRSCTPPSSSASSTHVFITVVVFAARR